MVPVTLPKLSFTQEAYINDAKKHKVAGKSLLEDNWFLINTIVAMLASTLSFWYCWTNHLTLLYGDGHSHLDIARRVIDNVTPGLAQLGGVWLPLPHVVMLPFIWNDYLWRSGLAGTIPSMICYVLAASYLFLSARLLTNDGLASFLGTLVFMVNPNVLYLQSTPLSELVLLATLNASCYYFLTWVRKQQVTNLMQAAFATFLATLARYDGWALYLVMLVMIILIGLLHRSPLAKIQSDLLIFGTLGGLGIILWFAWCAVILGDPLYFQRSVYSSQAQQLLLVHKHMDETYHNALLAIRDFFILSGETVGPLLLILALLAVLVFLLRSRLNPETVASLVFLMPFVFYSFSLYSGQAAVYAPGAVPATAHNHWYNTRYGVEAVTPVALFLATLVVRWPLGKLLLVLLVVAQNVVLYQGGVISLQDGQFGVSCFAYSEIPVYLARHYNGGYVLEDTYNTKQDTTSAGILLKDVIYQGSGKFWKQALADPASLAEWVVVEPGDEVSAAIDINSNPFLSQYTLVIEDPLTKVFLFHRNREGPVITRPIFDMLEHNYYQLCGSIK